MPKPYVIAGTDDEYGFPQYWTVDGEWGDFSRAQYFGPWLLTLPPGELPTGTVFIMDMGNYTLSHTDGV
jgi:hypothetical protein